MLTCAPKADRKIQASDGNEVVDGDTEPLAVHVPSLVKGLRVKVGLNEKRWPLIV